MLAKSSSFAGAEAAGVVLGARVPIVLTAARTAETRLASCAVAVLAHARRKAAAASIG